MRPILSTLAFLFWMGFSVVSGFETNLGSVKSLESDSAKASLDLPDYSERLNKSTLPYSKTTNRYQLALKRKAKFNSAKWLEGINEEGPLDSEESSFFASEAKHLVNNNTYESEYAEDLKNDSKWAEYVQEESTKHKGSSHPLEAL